MMGDFTGVTKHERAGASVFEVDTTKALYKGIPWRTLGRWGRRKFENLIFIQHAKENAQFIYL